MAGQQTQSWGQQKAREWWGAVLMRRWGGGEGEREGGERGEGAFLPELSLLRSSAGQSFFSLIFSLGSREQEQGRQAGRQQAGGRGEGPPTCSRGRGQPQVQIRPADRELHWTRSPVSGDLSGGTPLRLRGYGPREVQHITAPAPRASEAAGQDGSPMPLVRVNGSHMYIHTYLSCCSHRMAGVRRGRQLPAHTHARRSTLRAGTQDQA